MTAGGAAAGIAAPDRRRKGVCMNEATEMLRERVAQLDGEVGSLSAENKRLKRLISETIWALATAVDAKDPYTNGHSGRVADYSWQIAQRLGRDTEYQQRIYYAALLHDIGKIGVPDSVLHKPSRLNDEEYLLIKNHTNIGSEILEGITTVPDIAVGAKHHHERYDGGGYPDGLRGDAIPEIARIIAVADAYDAMTSKRTYNRIVSQDEVREEIRRSMGTQLDPEFAQVMLDLIDEDTEYRMHG